MKIPDQIKKLYRKVGGKWGVLFIAAFMFLVPVRCDGPHRGRIIDEATGQPLAGVLIVASWSYMIPDVGGGSSRCLDAAEALTDEKGDFEIPARHAALLRPLGSMTAEFYKIGYKRLAIGTWNAFRTGEVLSKVVKWEGNRVIIPLQTIAKDKLNTTDGWPPSISCGRSNGKPLEHYNTVREEFQQVLNQLHNHRYRR
ncbi:MAG: carboxypeptidase-like regulatory domain-containing protein [Desulfobacteraceae bacterium]|nr:carboxypeptidase-like regulatory domain-containing protein [Desulfobacteraceae bacterium]